MSSSMPKVATGRVSLACSRKRRFCSVSLASYATGAQIRIKQDDTLSPMLVTTTASWLVLVPLAYLLPRLAGLEADGIWLALTLGWIVQAALMGLRAIYVFTHDSIFLGEDGPTHQPISHLLTLRAIPNVTVLRPADANETAQAWKLAIENTSGPTAISLTRQKLPILQQAVDAGTEGVARGGYVVSDCEGVPDVLLLATGSEVALAMEAQQLLAADGTAARVVSLPSWELFEAQPAAYRDSVLPPEVTARVGVEMGIEQGWEKYVGPCSQGKGGRFLGMTGFGVSAPYQKLLQRYGFTADNIATQAKAAMGR